LSINSISVGSLFSGLSTITNLVSSNFSTGTLSINSISTGSIFASLSTISNFVSTNFSTGTLSINSISTGSIFAGNGVFTNLTANSLFNTTITSQGIYITGNVTTNNLLCINSNGSQTNPGGIIFTNTAGVGDFFIRGDGGDVQWVGGGGRACQMGAWHEIRLKGGSTTSTPIVQSNGTNALYNTIIQNTNNSIGLNVWAHTTQTNNLTQWTSSSAGNIYASVGPTGQININNTTNSDGTTGALIVQGGGTFNGDLYANRIYGTTIFGSSFNYTSSTESNSTSSQNYSTKLTMTTGNLETGTYIVMPSYSIYVTSTSRTAITELYLGNTNGTLIHESGYSISRTPNDLGVVTDNVILSLSGINTFIMVYKCAANGYTMTISNARLILYRVL
jgi:hypothetical protein